MHGTRINRMSEQIRAELAELIENEVADPRVGAVAVTGVRLSHDGKTALVQVSPLDPRAVDRECLQGLESARAFLRRELAARLQMRYTPDLKFAIDHGPQNAARVESLLDRIKRRTPLAVVLLFCLARPEGAGLPTCQAGQSKTPAAPKAAAAAAPATSKAPPASPAPAASAAPAGSAAPAAPKMLRYETSIAAMGSLYTIAAYGEDRAQLSSGVEAALQEARRIDDLLSNYKRQSELSEVNRDAARKPVKVSTELFDLLEKCQQYSRLSDGAFDWTVGPLMRVWGFHRDSGRLPGREEIQQAMKSVGYQHIHLDRQERTVSFDTSGVDLDPGGVGKGYAVDRMADVLRDAGIHSALISAAGSSIYAIGAPPGEKGWYVRIRDPKSEQVTAGEVYLKDESLSTSGSYEKFFEADGKIYSHIMDPRTGYPAQGMLSVSVVTPKTLDSEVWAKPFFVNGAEWARKHLPQGFRVLLCEEGKPCYWVP